MTVLITLVGLAAIGTIVLHLAGPILKGRLTKTLSTRFHSRVELDHLNASALTGLDISGDRLRIYPPDALIAAGAKQPLIAIHHFSFHSGQRYNAKIVVDEIVCNKSQLIIGTSKPDKDPKVFDLRRSKQKEKLDVTFGSPTLLGVARVDR